VNFPRVGIPSSSTHSPPCAPEVEQRPLLQAGYGMRMAEPSLIEGRMRASRGFWLLGRPDMRPLGRVAWHVGRLVRNCINWYGRDLPCMHSIRVATVVYALVV
jgi:hypothetical protein